MPAAWEERFVIGYGPGMKLLGTSPGGDSGSLDIGPEYGFSGRGRLVAVDPSDGTMRARRHLRTPSGVPFSLKVGDQVTIEVAVTSKVLPIRTSSGAPAHVGVQVRAGADGTLHVYLIGSGEDDESVQLVGATKVSPDGKVAEVEPLVNPGDGLSEPRKHCHLPSTRALQPGLHTARGRLSATVGGHT